ncbi:hypothetical protein E4631_05480 [Hymenobacter sp. UV11]|uniref:hypothetical protein n=1 Tax=Hymenobacter sp. UV11 TaxID=1849735 RepID=UPI001060C896|nr:hypothetical protein [Hymenobacter sp. UV11]TDN35826.1 hypothetical protein A8B98_12320 [Hymenobacter sp. UV11]TFZ67438.1 hypothetical protein E4631_05480 [Hymenobacter sp. UV11]
MELDDLRRHWQQHEPVAPTGLTADSLIALLAHQRVGVVEKMRRNARWEMALMVALAVFTAGFLPYVPELGLLPYLTLLLALGLFYYYYRVLGVLRQMTETASSVRSHLMLLCFGLRQLLRFNYRLTLAMVPVTMLTVLGMPFGREMVHIGQQLGRQEQVNWGRLLLLTGIGLAAGALMQVLVIPVTRWYLQRLYGQHLDRLERQLRELDDSELPTSPSLAPDFTA